MELIHGKGKMVNSASEQQDVADPFGGLPKCVAPETMAAVAIEMARLKTQLDNLARNCDPLTDLLHEQFATGDAMAPSTFVETIVPFIDWLRLRSIASPSSFFGLLDAQVVIGSSWRWFPNDPAEPTGRNENKALLRKLQAWAADFASGAASDYLQVASCTWLPSLGIAYADEGKNRVALYRACGAEFIPSLIRPYGYPEANRMTRYHVGGRQLAVLDKRWVTPILGGRVSHALLDAYGVAVECGWPADLPPFDEVVRTLDSPSKGRFWHLRERAPLHVGACLDLFVLAQRLKTRQEDAVRASEIVVASILDVDGVRVSYRFLVCAALGFILSLVLYKLSLQVNVGQWCLGAAGMCLGMTMLPFCRIWRVKRSLTKHSRP